VILAQSIELIGHDHVSAGPTSHSFRLIKGVNVHVSVLRPCPRVYMKSNIQVNNNISSADSKLI